LDLGITAKAAYAYQHKPLSLFEVYGKSKERNLKIALSWWAADEL